MAHKSRATKGEQMSDNKKTEIIFMAIREALGNHSRFFQITPNEILVNESNEFSILIEFSPLTDIELEDGIVRGGTHVSVCMTTILFSLNTFRLQTPIVTGKLVAFVY